MGWFDSFKSKKIKCKLCDNIEYKKNIYLFEMNTAEGLHKIKICQECANTLDKMIGDKKI